MAAAVNNLYHNLTQEQLPMIEWSLGENPVFTVRSTQAGEYRRFDLLLDKTYLDHSPLLKISDIGNCLQHWRRVDAQHNVSVRMFVTTKLQVIYFVIADLLHRKIGACLEKPLSAAKLNARLYDEEPCIDESFFAWFYSLSQTLSWGHINTNLPEVWARDHEQSEVGLCRWQYSNGAICKDRVVRGVHAKQYVELISTKKWNRLHIIESEVIGTVDDTNQITWIPQVKRTKGFAYQVLDMVNQAVTVCQLRAGPVVEINQIFFCIYQRQPGGICTFTPFNPDADTGGGFRSFMKDEDLSLVSHKRIAKYFQTQCLSIQETNAQAKYNQIDCTVKKEIYSFDNSLKLPTVHIHLSRGFIQQIITAVKLICPNEHEEQIYGTEIGQEEIKKAVLRPDGSAENKRRGFTELDKAYDSVASIDIFLSFDKRFAEVVADQKLYWAYSKRTGQKARKPLPQELPSIV